MKRLSTFLIIRETEIKIKMRCHFTLIWMAIIKKSTNSKCWRGGGEKGPLIHCWWEWKLVQPLRRTVWRFLKKLKIEWPYDPAIQLLGMYPEKTIIQNDICTPMFIAALFTTAKTTEATLISISRSMDNEKAVHMHSGMVLSYKKEWIWVSSDTVDEPRACYTE